MAAWGGRLHPAAVGIRELPSDIKEDRIDQAQRIFSFDRGNDRARHRGFPELNGLGHEDRVHQAIEAIFARQFGPRQIAALFQALIDPQRHTTQTAARARGLE